MHQEVKLARGLMFKEGKVLLVQDQRPGQGFYFLPGGKVEKGEAIERALSREWMEELGWEVKISSFLGCLEHAWDQVIEVSFIFLLETYGLQDDLTSLENHLLFSWVSVSELDDLDLRPYPLKALIPKAFSHSPSALWASSLMTQTSS